MLAVVLLLDYFELEHRCRLTYIIGDPRLELGTSPLSEERSNHLS